MYIRLSTNNPSAIESIMNMVRKIRLVADVFNFGIAGIRVGLILYIRKRSLSHCWVAMGTIMGVATGLSDRSCASRVLDPSRLYIHVFLIFGFLPLLSEFFFRPTSTNPKEFTIHHILHQNK